MKNLSNNDFQFIKSLNHQDKLFVFALKKEENKTYADMYYSVQDKQREAEEEEARTDKGGEIKENRATSVDDNWRPFEPLSFPTWVRPIGSRLGAYQVEGLDSESNLANTTEVYTQEMDFSVVSDGETITLFRKVAGNQAEGQAAPDGKLRIFADRFFYNLEFGKLINVNEVRYVRSNSPDVPNSVLDSFGVSSPEGDTFLEPSSELVLDASNDDEVAVIQLPAVGQLYQSVWHFLTNNPLQTEGKSCIKVFSIPKSTSVLFDTTYLPTTIQNHIPLVTSFVMQDAAKNNATNISNLTASLYCQNEEFVNEDGVALSMKKGGNLMIAFSANFPQYNEPQLVACMDMEVGIDGYFAGASPGKLGAERSLNCAPFLYYGTAVELDGQEDYLITTTPQNLSKDTTEQSVIIGGWFKPKPSNNSTQLCNVMKVSSGLANIFLNIDQQGKLYLTSDPSKMRMISNADIPQMLANQWSFITMKIISYHPDRPLNIELVVNGVMAVNSVDVGANPLDFKNLTFTLGRKEDNNQLKGFAGQIAAAGFSNSDTGVLEFPDLKYFSEGCRNVAGTNFTMYGAEWIPSITPACDSLNLQFFDEKLLAVRTAILGLGNSTSTELLWPVQTNGTMSLLDAKDGFLKLFYPRSSDRKVGVCHFDPSVYHAQKLLYTRTGITTDLFVPSLVITALSPGSEMNGFFFSLKETSGKYVVEISQTLDYLNGSKLTIQEKWTNIPSSIREASLTTLQLAAIINGTANEIYDYTYFTQTITCNSSGYDKNPLAEILLNHKGSILVQADVLNKNNEVTLEALLASLNNNILSANYYGVGSSWVLDPLLPVLRFEDETEFNVIKNYQQIVPSSFTIENWFRYVNQNYDESLMVLPASAFSTNSHVSILNSNALRMDLLSNENGGQALSYQTADGALNEDNKWQHLAVTYESGHALQFDNQTYVEVAHDASFNTKEGFTVETWYYNAAGGESDQILLSKWGGKEEGQSWALRKKDASICFDIRDNSLGQGTFTKSASMLNNTWHHIAASYTPAQTHNLLHFTPKENEPDGHVVIGDLMKTLPNSTTIEFKAAISLDPNNYETKIAALGYPNSSNENDYESLLSFTCKTDKKLLRVRFLGKDFDFNYNFVKDQLTHFSFVIEIKENDVTIRMYVDGTEQQIIASVKDAAWNEAWQRYTEKMKNATQSLKWVLGAGFNNENPDLLTHYHFLGYLGEFRVWNLRRTEQQIIDYTNVAVQPDEDGLLGLFIMNQKPLGNSNMEQSSEIYITNQVTNRNYFASSAKNVFWDTLSSPAKAMIKINENITSYASAISSTINQNITSLCFGKYAEKDAQLLGKLDNVRLWRQTRTEAQLNYYQDHSLEKSIKEERNMSAYLHLIAAWGFDEGKGNIVRDSAGKHEGKIKGVVIKDDETNHNIWSPSTRNGELKVYINGVYSPPVELGNVGMPSLPNRSNLTILSLFQDMGELRLWSMARTQEAIKKSMNRRLVGNEKNLAGYWAMTDGINTIIDESQYQANGTVTNGGWRELTDSLYLPIPISQDPMLCINATNGIAYPESDGIEVVGGVTATEFNGFKELFLGFVNAKADETKLALSIDEHPEEPVLVYIGQAQYNPKIVGFIEGAPPVPSENLSVDTSTTPDKYGNTAKVILTSEGEAKTTHGISKNQSLQVEMEGLLGLVAKQETSASTGFVVAEIETLVAEVEGSAGVSLGNNIGVSYGSSRENSSQNSRTVHYELGLWGSWENNIYNLANVPADKLYIQAPRIYRPNNMGVAVVKSRTADLYALQDPKTGRTISYQFKLDPNIPEDVNYILFKINPAYLKNGSLDGRIGYDTDIDYPDLEKQDKASFFKAQEAYQLETKIERQQKEWQNSLSQILGRNTDVEGRAKGISLVNNYIWTADGGLMSDSKQLSVSHEEKHEIGSNSDIKMSGGFEGKAYFGLPILVGPHVKLDLSLGAGIGIAYTKTKSSAASLNLEVEVSGEGFLSMQADMSEQEAIPIVAATEEQYNANLATLNEGYTKDLASRNANFYTALQKAGIIPTTGSTKYLVKRLGFNEWEWQSASQSFRVTTDDNSYTINFTPNNTAQPNEYPIRYQANNCPGKVTGYRFKTFYLKADKENFDVLKNGYESDVPLIDPTWLANEGNPDALAMRKALEKSNSIWRIFHRVTYVSRVPPNNDIAPQVFDDPSETANETPLTWIDAAAQVLQKPDEISIANNYWLIQLVLGKTGNPQYIEIDSVTFNEADLKKNINTWINTHIQTHSLSEVEQQRLYYLMLNYFRAYLVEEKKV